ncbi:c-type cytochrome [Dechloromonas sp.]|uniref:c-type cytochrome n=1 Tax=Dechloromonas sp. TaxID=1917218 RepID=UPI00122085C8|nr:c-type cytochrome [Dechloromonas sp.]MBU3697138.1 c-type cytochrome [Dechloromonas sp.]TEX44199.1 MAG: cytochrome C552 [Rhodocyclaceae bacterium]
MHHGRNLSVLVLGLVMAGTTLADPKADTEALKLATSSGCMTCHSIESGKPGPSGMKPIGPAWQDVARQYKGKPGNVEFLTRVVLEGSNPYSSHWKDKVSGLSMPPNAVAITEGNARKLVSWILALN